MMTSSEEEREIKVFNDMKKAAAQLEVEKNRGDWETIDNTICTYVQKLLREKC